MAKFMYVPMAKGKTDGFTGNPKAGWKDCTARYLTEGLADVGADDKLYLVGHGSESGLSLQTLTTANLLEVLKMEGLNTNHKDFYLFSCYSGVKMPGAGKSFAEAFAYEIRDYYKSAKVVGYIGAVQFNRNGKEQTKTVSTMTHFLPGNSSNALDSILSTSMKVSFSVARKFIGTNSVVANQADSYEASITEEEETLSFMGESVQRQYERIVVVDSAVMVGRPRR